uniref:Dynactin subunit 5 n=1 Tax=Skeletonema marinoi TaxID=267567 RepID=A0A7S1CU30_9STRA|mmetsp:Transcript_2236/g.3299  ORF Transcript_2236/g.3299 Transcript_2236/m.3299 type:complete len:205 (+) Transcript_2236:40-654(+)
MPTSKSEYIVTASQSYISRSANILVAPNLHSKGKSVIQKNVTIHGEFGAAIHIGRYVYIDEDVEIVPSVIPTSSDPLLTTSSSSGSGGVGSKIIPQPPTENEKALPVIIGSHTKIGNNCTIHSIAIGSCVRIGSNCRIYPRSKIHDCCIIENDSVIPPDMVISPFSRVRGNPARIVGSLPECSGGEFVEDCVQEYTRFVRELGE